MKEVAPWGGCFLVRPCNVIWAPGLFIASMKSFLQLNLYPKMKFNLNGKSSAFSRFIPARKDTCKAAAFSSRVNTGLGHHLITACYRKPPGGYGQEYRCPCPCPKYKCLHKDCPLLFTSLSFISIDVIIIITQIIIIIHITHSVIV